MQKKRNMTVKQIAQVLSEETSQGRTNTHKDGRRDELTDEETEGGRDGGRRSNHRERRGNWS